MTKHKLGQRKSFDWDSLDPYLLERFLWESLSQKLTTIQLLISQKNLVEFIKFSIPRKLILKKLFSRNPTKALIVTTKNSLLFFPCKYSLVGENQAKHKLQIKASNQNSRHFQCKLVLSTSYPTINFYQVAVCGVHNEGQISIS